MAKTHAVNILEKTIDDKGTFKLFLFLVGNGCAPTVAAEWLLTSAAWDRESIRKRADQIKWIDHNMFLNGMQGETLKVITYSAACIQWRYK